MKSTLLIFISIYCSSLGFSQSTPRFRHGFDFSRFKELDSTSYVLIPTEWKNNGKIANIKVEGSGDTKNILFYNTITDDYKMLFSDSIQIIKTYKGHLLNKRYPSDTSSRPPDKLLIYYTVINHDYNGDNTLDTDDPRYLYCSRFDGLEMMQLTPRTYNLVDYKYISTSNIILAVLIKDGNEDRKFDHNDSEVLYKIDLNDLSASKVIAVMNIRKDGK